MIASIIWTPSPQWTTIIILSSDASESRAAASWYYWMGQNDCNLMLHLTPNYLTKHVLKISGVVIAQLTAVAGLSESICALLKKNFG